MKTKSRLTITLSHDLLVKVDALIDEQKQTELQQQQLEMAMAGGQAMQQVGDGQAAMDEAGMEMPQ